MANPARFSLIAAASVLLIASSVVADWSILNLSPRVRVRARARNSEVLGDSLKKYCESWRVNVEVHNVRDFEVVPEECVTYIEKYMTSSQYRLDSEKALEEVKLYLSGCCCDVKDDGKDAWIFDVDDTLLSTIPYYRKHGFGGRKRNVTSLEAWMAQSDAPALKATLEIFDQIKDKGLKIFLISSRREALRTPTAANLVDVGFHGWAALFLRSPKDETIGVKSYKSAVRQRLVNEGYRIWGIVGDQWSSLEGHHGARRAFKLPNSIYYI